MTTASLSAPLGVVDHAEVVGTYVVRNFFSLCFLSSWIALTYWSQAQAQAAGAPDGQLTGSTAVMWVMLFLPVVAAAKPVERAYRPTEADGVIRWCRATPVGGSAGALWVRQQSLRVVGYGYDEHIVLADIVQVEARVKGPSSWAAKLLSQTHPLVLTKSDGTEVSLIVHAPTSVARTIRRALSAAS